MPASVPTPGIPLSMLDVGWPGDLTALARLAEQWGYHRYWATEHHSPHQSGNPILAAAHAAGQTSQLRVGTAAVLLTFSSPFRIAEDYRLLEVLFPGRFDLGVAGGGTTGPARAPLLDERPEPAGDAFSRRVEQLVRQLATGDNRPAGPEAGPRPRTAGGGPRLWLCGMSARTARLAGQLGLAFGYSEHLRLNPPAAVEPADAVLTAYRQALDGRPGRISVACYGICAGSGQRARQLWSERCARAGKRLRPSFLGTPEDCRRQLAAIAESYQATELAVESFTDSLPDRLESFRLLAEVWGLRPRPATGRPAPEGQPPAGQSALAGLAAQQ